jgi:predicted SAM-dependent methyltransferase
MKASTGWFGGIRNKTRPYRRQLRDKVFRPARLVAIRTVRLFWRRPYPKMAGDKVYVHLGCGPVNHPLFVNVDTVPAWHLHYIHMVDRLPMFRDESVDLVYSSHCLEHIPFGQTRRVLMEWRRILKPGGLLYLSVPNFDVIVRYYQEHGKKIEAMQGFLLGGQEYPSNFHYALFNETSLREHLSAVGFREIQNWSHDDIPEIAMVDFSRLNIISPVATYPISINMMGTK